MMIFGTKKLKNIGTDLGGAVKGFKDGMKDGGGPAQDPNAADGAGIAKDVGNPRPDQAYRRANETPELQCRN